MFESDEKIEKWRVEVEVNLDDGARLLGILFVTPMQRLSDLLNDSREFLPLQTTDGLIVHIRKSTIAKAVQLNQNVESNAIIDPYEVLGVPRRIGDKELKKAYHNLCSQNHPDKLLPLDLSPDFTKMANLRLSRIIDAYKRIVTMRRSAQGNGQSNGQSNGQNAKAASEPFH